MSANITNERSKRNFRKVKSLNLRKPEDLEEISQGIDDLTSLMKLKKILFAGEVFDESVIGGDKRNVLKNKMKLNAQAKLSSKKSLGIEKEDEKESPEDDEPVIPIPLNVSNTKPKEWENVNISIQEEFWKEHSEVKGDYHYGIAVKGWRQTMEDFVDAKSSISSDTPNLFGVFDGHGGETCANYCKKFLLQKLAKSPELLTKPTVTLQNVFTDIHEEYSRTFKDGKEGSTATTLVIVPVDVVKQEKQAKNNGVRTKAESNNPRYNKKKQRKQTTSQRIYTNIRKAASLREEKRQFKFYCACVGDSRAVLVYNTGRVVELSFDHTLRRKDELERIRMSGGEIRYDPEYNEMLVYSETAQRGLNVTRSIGDSYFKPWVMHLPEIKEGFLTKDAAFFLVASDGLWSHVKSDEVGNIMMHSGLENGIKNLANLSNKRGCYDNCSIMAVDIQTMLRNLNEKLDG